MSCHASPGFAVILGGQDAKGGAGGRGRPRIRAPRRGRLVLTTSPALRSANAGELVRLAHDGVAQLRGYEIEYEQTDDSTIRAFAGARAQRPSRAGPYARFMI